MWHIAGAVKITHNYLKDKLLHTTVQQYRTKQLNARAVFKLWTSKGPEKIHDLITPLEELRREFNLYRTKVIKSLSA